MSDRTELIQSFKTGSVRLRNTVAAIPAEALDFKPSPDAWSIREIVIHMPESEASGFVRIRKIIAQPGVEVDVYEQDAWADKLNYAAQEIKPALDLFEHMRRSTSALLDDVDETVWTENYVMHPEDGKMTGEVWLKAYARHVDKHIGQIMRNLEAWDKTGRP